MERKIQLTADGSHTISVPALGVSYHSRYGAIQESMHVFIKAGLHYVLSGRKQDEVLYVFEMGFGTGLNAFLTAMESRERKVSIHYTAVELFPLSEQEVQELNYTHMLGHADLFQQLHNCPWNQSVQVHAFFTLKKLQVSLLHFSTADHFNLTYYDAFAPGAQPELWTEEVFSHLFQLTAPGGVLVTYCAKGSVRRALQRAGFEVEKLPGPPGKREMLRARSPA
jgi:tRNA U34 5-methylaminomethyl-2-thiouridine-forming methyltransferase MnmC